MSEKLTGLFFGSFNPIHNGHLNIANYLIKEHYCSEVWFVVSPQNPLKTVSSLLDEKLRIKLVDKAIKDFAQLKACDIEFNMHRPSYTIETLRKLQLDFPDKNFALVIGEDNLRNFKKWKSYKELLSNYKIFVYPRIEDSQKYEDPFKVKNSSKIENLSKFKVSSKTNALDYNYLSKFRVERVCAPLSMVSSTQIRNKILRGDDINSLVPSSILLETIKYYLK